MRLSHSFLTALTDDFPFISSGQLVDPSQQPDAAWALLGTTQVCSCLARFCSVPLLRSCLRFVRKWRHCVGQNHDNRGERRIPDTVKTSTSVLSNSDADGSEEAEFPRLMTRHASALELLHQVCITNARPAMSPERPDSAVVGDALLSNKVATFTDTSEPPQLETFSGIPAEGSTQDWHVSPEPDLENLQW